MTARKPGASRPATGHDLVMSVRVRAFDDAAAVLDTASGFLASEPVHHNLILSLLERCVATGDPGRFWTVESDGQATGVVLQSPLHFFATVTPMCEAAVVAAADAIAVQGVELPGVHGEAATAASFAGWWTEVTRAGAKPVEGSRLYEVDDVIPPPRSGGSCRLANERDRQLLVEWFEAFEVESAVVPEGDVRPGVDRRIAAGQLWLWEDAGTAVSFAGLSAPVVGAARVGPVYTPPAARGRGYASAVVADISRRTRADATRCLLYTELGNPTSNGIYRALGYRAVSELTRYEFTAAP